MLIQRKSDKKFLTLAFGWVRDPRNPSLASTTHAHLPDICGRVNIDQLEVELVTFEEAYKSKATQ